MTAPAPPATVQPVVLKLDQSNCPAVNATSLRQALERARQCDQASPDDSEQAVEAFAAAVRQRWGQGPSALALWSRARALLSWQARADVVESERLMVESWCMEARVGYGGDPRTSMLLEAEARLLAAASHPLDQAGRFSDINGGFRASIAKARAELLAPPEGATIH